VRSDVVIDAQIKGAKSSWPGSAAMEGNSSLKIGDNQRRDSCLLEHKDVNVTHIDM